MRVDLGCGLKELHIISENLWLRVRAYTFYGVVVVVFDVRL
eukprot:gene2939-1921_t